jgi:hypothetical protein
MPVRTCEACGKSFTQSRGRPARYCPQHRNGAGKYGVDHQRLRAAAIGQAWGLPCTRCGLPLVQGQEIHLDHRDGGGPGDYRGWSHASCNMAAGAAKGNRMRGRLNGRRAAAAVAPEAAAVVVPEAGLGPPARHPPDCRCGGSVVYRPGMFWTSRCW